MSWQRRLLVAGTALVAACGDSAGPRGEPRLELDRTAVSVYEGADVRVTATYFDEQGRAVGGPPAGPQVQWSSANDAVATVDAAGSIRGVKVGHTIVTASAGSARAMVDVTVMADVAQPSVAALTVVPNPVNLAGGDAQIAVTVQLRDPETGVRDVFIGIAEPNGASEDFTCRPPAQVSGTIRDGEWRCSVPFNRYMPPGRWIAYVVATDAAGNTRYVDQSIDVVGSLPDAEAPAVTALGFVPDSVDVRAQAAIVSVEVGVADAHSGFRRLDLVVTGPDGRQLACATLGGDLPNERTQLTVACGMIIARSSPAGTWSVTSVRVTDMRGNVASYTQAQLQARGFRTTFKVT